MSDLKKRCEEVLDWHRTGLLIDGALRELAARMPSAHEHERLRIAENRTADEAMRFVIANGQNQDDKI